MADEHSAQERTEQATQKRKSDARKKGDVLRSRELTIFLSLMAAGGAILVFGPQIMLDLQELVRSNLALSHEAVFNEKGIQSALLQAVRMTGLMLLPFMLVMLFALGSTPVVLGGWIMNAGLLVPKAERIDPLKGLARIFSPSGLIELVKAIGKCTLVGGSVFLVVRMMMDDILSLSGLPIHQALASTGSMFAWCFLGFSAVLALVAAMDVPFQIMSFKNKLKMTRQEIKDEMKETEGRPEVKSAIRERQQQVARQRMMAAVPTADVVITNPTHFAVALKYEEAGNSAPVVVAKGRDHVAASIREIARANDVTLFSAPPLARALYASTEINQQIPENLFLAVAQVLAYVFQLRDAVAGRKKPRPPSDIPVPGDYENALRERGE